MQLRQGEDARPDTKRMSCHPTQSRQGEDARSSVKVMSCHPTQLRQGEDARHFIVSAKLMSCHPTQSRQGEDAQPSVKLMSCHPMQLRQWEDARQFIMDLGNVDYEASHIILSRWNVCIPGPHHSNAAKPTSLLHDRRFVDKIEIYKSELDPKHDWLYSP